MKKRPVYRSTLARLGEPLGNPISAVSWAALAYRQDPCPERHRVLGHAVQASVRAGGGRWNGHCWVAP